MKLNEVCLDIYLLPVIAHVQVSSAYLDNDRAKMVGSEQAIAQTLPISKGTLWLNQLRGQFSLYCYSSSHMISVYAKCNSNNQLDAHAVT